MTRRRKKSGGGAGLALVAIVALAILVSHNGTPSPRVADTGATPVPATETGQPSVADQSAGTPRSSATATKAPAAVGKIPTPRPSHNVTSPTPRPSHPAPSTVPTATVAPTSTPAKTAPPLTSGASVDPNPGLTPGVTDPAVSQATIGSTVCVSGYTQTVRPPSSYTSALKISQIAQYGYADTNPADYEEDHLISLELGGSPRDPRNLWPERWTITASDGEPAGARVKDHFENYLHAQVCSGALLLVAAQGQIATDWFGAWIADGRP